MVWIEYHRLVLLNVEDSHSIELVRHLLRCNPYFFCNNFGCLFWILSDDFHSFIDGAHVCNNFSSLFLNNLFSCNQTARNNVRISGGKYNFPPTLHGQVKTWFEQAQALNFEGITISYDERVEKGHHRTERRQVWSVPVSQLPLLYRQADWVGLKTVVIVVRVRHLRSGLLGDLYTAVHACCFEGWS